MIKLRVESNQTRCITCILRGEELDPQEMCQQSGSAERRCYSRGVHRSAKTVTHRYLSKGGKRSPVKQT